MNIYRFCAGLLVWCLGVAQVHCGDCPNGWSMHEKFCFLFKKETHTWFDAELECVRLGGYLAEGNSYSRHQFLNRLVERHGFTSGFTWIGLTDLDKENVFVWNHSGQKANPIFWGPSEPQDWQGNEDCVMLRNGLWNDLNCKDGRPHFICEMPYA